MNAFLREVIATGALHEVPSADVATSTLFTSHPGSKRQSCHVTHTRPEGSTSAEGSGKKRRSRIELTWISATCTAAPKLRPPSRETDEPIRLPPQLKITTRSPVGRTTGKAPTASVTAMRDRSRPADAAVGRRQHREAPVADGVRVRRGSSVRVSDSAAPLSQTTQFLSKITPLDEAPSIAITGLLHVKPSLERLIVRRVIWFWIASVEMSHVRVAASYATTGSLARTCGPGGHALLREAGKEPAPPGASVVARDREPDVVRAAVDAAADLVRDHGRPSDGEAVRLDLRLVLPGRRRVRIAGEPPPDELAVGRDDVGQVGVHDVEPGAAADGVPGAVVLGRDPVDPGPGDEAVAAGPAVQEVGAGERGQPVSAAAAEQHVGARRSHEPVAPVRSLDRPRGRGAAQDQEQREHDGGNTHFAHPRRPSAHLG